MFIFGTVNICIVLSTAICLIAVHLFLAVMSRGLITIPTQVAASSLRLRLVLLVASIFLFLIGLFILILVITLV